MTSWGTCVERSGSVSLPVRNGPLLPSAVPDRNHDMEEEEEKEQVQTQTDCSATHVRTLRNTPLSSRYTGSSAIVPLRWADFLLAGHVVLLLCEIT